MLLQLRLDGRQCINQRPSYQSKTFVNWVPLPLRPSLLITKRDDDIHQKGEDTRPSLTELMDKGLIQAEYVRRFWPWWAIIVLASHETFLH